MCTKKCNNSQVVTVLCGSPKIGLKVETEWNSHTPFWSVLIWAELLSEVKSYFRCKHNIEFVVIHISGREVSVLSILLLLINKNRFTFKFYHQNFGIGWIQCIPLGETKMYIYRSSKPLALQRLLASFTPNHLYCTLQHVRPFYYCELWFRQHIRQRRSIVLRR